MQEELKQVTNEINIPIVGKKRIATYNGFIGQSERIIINGQVIDVPFLEDYLDQDLDIFCMIPNSIINRFRAIQDINISSVSKPRIQIELIPMESMTMEELIKTKPIATIENLTGSNQGTFEIPLKKLISKLESGKYLLRTNLKGIDSIRQNFLDLARITTNTKNFFSENLPIGFGRLTILPENYEGFIIISDIDKTFLNTRFEDRQGLMETLLERIENKKPIPGMDEFFRKLKSLDYPLLFISASPTFFRRVLEGVFKRFQIPIEGLYLKKLSEPVSNISTKIFQVAANLNYYISQGLDEMLNRSLKFLNSTLQSFVDQTAYKLKVLLKIRRMQPSFAKEILIGDNTESDFLVFILYQILLLEMIPQNDIVEFLYHLRFKEKEIFSRDLAFQVQQLVKENIEIHGKINPVYFCLIHQAYEEPDQEGIYKAIEKTLNIGIDKLEKENIKLPRIYQSMWQLSFEFFKKNIIMKKDLKDLLQYSLKIQPQEKEKIILELKKYSLDFEIE